MFLWRSYGAGKSQKLTSQLTNEGNLVVLYPDKSSDIYKSSEQLSTSSATLAFKAVSTGKVEELDIKDCFSGSLLAKASVLKILTKDFSGKMKELGVVIQLLNKDGSRNYFPGIVQTLSKIHSFDTKSNILSNDQLASYFPEGKSWTFIPKIILDGDATLQNSTLNFANIVQRYYCNNGVDVKNFFEKGMQGNFNKLIFLTGLSETKQIQ